MLTACSKTDKKIQKLKVFLYFLIKLIFSASQKDLLATIAKDGHLSETTDKALHKVVVDFMASFV